MPYRTGELLAVGDRIKDSNGKLGTVTSYVGRIFTVRWDEGVVDLQYSLAEKFTLVSRVTDARL